MMDPHDTPVRDERGSNLVEAIRRRFAPLGGVVLVPHPPVRLRASPDFDAIADG